MTPWVRITALLIALVAGVGVSSGVAGADAANAPVAARVTYQWQPCSSAPDRLVVPRPVTAGTLVLRRAGSRKRVSLVPGGTVPARIALPGTGRVRATLELVTPRVRVSDASGGGVRRIALGSAVVRNGRVSFPVPRSADHGHVNTLIVLQRAARLAAVTAPRQLRRLTARTYPGDPAGRPEIAFDTPATIHVGRVGASADAEWEAAALAHEYGHFVLHSLGAEGPDGGDHDSGRSYPGQPTLAWNEGFSHAFAATVLDEGRGSLTVDCRPAFNLADQPARPTLATDADRRYAQYSEARVAGATYQLITRLGGGRAGLKRLLRAFPGYRRDGHGVWTARDLRDLVASAFERSSADHAAFDRIFFSQGISWARRVTVGVPFSDPEFERIQQAQATLVVRLSGPGGLDCRAVADIDPATTTPIDGGLFAFGLKRAEGGLGFSADDDCYVVSGTDTIDFLKPHTFGGDSIEIPFPHLPGLAHWGGDYTVYAKYLCQFEPTADPAFAYCPVAKQAAVAADNLVLLATTPGSRTPVPVTLPRGVETVVATFRAKGDCHVGTSDCGV